MKNLAYLCAVAATAVLGACASEGGSVEDPKDDSFTSEGKEDAFGVEDWSPDGAAVIKLASTATKAKLQSAGLSVKVATSLIAAREALPGKKFTTLHQMDQADYVGKSVFQALLKYAADKKLFKTSLRIPLLLDDNDATSITKYNDKARAAGLTAFAPYVYVDADTKYGARADSYNARLQALATKAGITIDSEVKRYAGSLGEFESAGFTPCYIGNAADAVDIATAHTDEMMSDMYIQWASRYGHQKWLDDGVDPANFDADTGWTSFDEDSDEFLVISSANDDGDSNTPSLIGNCRK